MRLVRFIFSLLLLLAVCVPAHAQTFNSGSKRVSVLELYTSEGCSSCPPADKWFSKLLQDKRLWTELVPVAFHVDYWNYIGWKDPFSNKRYSQRQRQYADEKNIRSVYTPGMVLNGKEWRSWFSLRPWDLNSETEAGMLWIQIDSGRVNAEYKPLLNDADKPVVLTIAILGFGLTSEITAGENSGRTLSHDFVVLGYETKKMNRTATGVFTNNAPLPMVQSLSVDQTAVVAWVSFNGDLTPVQATGGWWSPGDPG